MYSSWSLHQISSIGWIDISPALVKSRDGLSIPYIDQLSFSVGKLVNSDYYTLKMRRHIALAYLFHFGVASVFLKG